MSIFQMKNKREDALVFLYQNDLQIFYERMMGIKVFHQRMMCIKIFHQRARKPLAHAS